MNKGVLITNIQKIITSLDHTKEILVNLFSKEKCYSKQYLQKKSSLLRVKLQSDDNYKKLSTKPSILKSKLAKIQAKKIDLSKIISSLEDEIIFLDYEIEEQKALISEYQREYEILADSLGFSENDQQLFEKIKIKENQIKHLQGLVSASLIEIDNKRKSIVKFNEEIEKLNVNEDLCCNELENIKLYTLDEKTKLSDISKLNNFEHLVNVADISQYISNIVKRLSDLIVYIGKRESRKENVDEMIVPIKEMISELNNIILQYINSIDLTDLNEEKAIINNRLESSGYKIDDEDKKIISDEISSLELKLSLLKNQQLSDEQSLIEYAQRVDGLNMDIERENHNIIVIRSRISELNLSIHLFSNDNSYAQIECATKEMKKKQKEEQIHQKQKERLIKYKIDAENTLRSIKKSKKNSEYLLSDLEQTLKSKKEYLTEGITSKYDLDEDKNQLLYIDLNFELVEILTKLLSQKYINKLDEIDIESYDPLSEIIGFYEFENVPVLYSDEFIEAVRATMDRMIRFGNVDHKNTAFIRFLNDKGLKVTRYGKSLRTMEEQKEQTKEFLR